MAHICSVYSQTTLSDKLGNCGADRTTLIKQNEWRESKMSSDKLGKTLGTYATSKGYKVLISEHKNIKETLQINQKCQTFQQKNEPRLFSAKSQEIIEGPGTYAKNPSLVSNQGNSNESNSGSPFLSTRFAKVKNTDEHLMLRISRNGFSLK